MPGWQHARGPSCEYGRQLATLPQYAAQYTASVFGYRYEPRLDASPPLHFGNIMWHGDQTFRHNIFVVWLLGGMHPQHPQWCIRACYRCMCCESKLLRPWLVLEHRGWWKALYTWQFISRDSKLTTTIKDASAPAHLLLREGCEQEILWRWRNTGLVVGKKSTGRCKCNV